MNNQNRTKVITSVNTRLSYFHGWEPVSINGGAEKYSVSVLIPKTDTETINAINAAIDAAIEEGIAKFGGKKPNKSVIKIPLRDGDERDDEAYKALTLKKSLMEIEPGPAEVLSSILYLLQSRYVTGRVLPLDGGRHLKPF